jgi:hypothetical protein
MGMRSLVWGVVAFGLCATAWAEFALEDDGGRLTIREDGRPVLAYNYAPVAPPDGLDPHRWARACYIHPLYGRDGDVLTQDFPVDHRHHRGVFWAWPHTHAGERRMDVWLHEDCEQRFERWVRREAGVDRAEVEVENAWVFKGNPEPVVRETVALTVHPADAVGRAIDFRLAFRNVSQQPVSFLGATGKGYGGFCIRPDAERTELRFTSARGPRKEDALYLESPWADQTSRAKPEGPVSGTAVFQHPGNPGYPHPGWILRNYGFLGVSWPHLQTEVLAPGQEVELRYRVYVHRGTAEEAKVAEAFAAYESAEKARPAAE